MKLIDADELKKMFPDKGEGAWTYNITAKAYIDAQPTVDLWHYPSKGEYPKENESVCASVYGFDKPMIVRWCKDEKDELCWQDCWDCCLYNADEVRCWQYIIPPVFIPKEVK